MVELARRRAEQVVHAAAHRVLGGPRPPAEAQQGVDMPSGRSARPSCRRSSGRRRGRSAGSSPRIRRARRVSVAWSWRIEGVSVSSSNASKWVFVNENQGPLPTLASIRVQPRVTSIGTAPATVTFSRFAKCPPVGFLVFTCLRLADEDHVTHRQTAVQLGVIEVGAGAGDLAVVGDLVLVGGSLEVELVLDDRDPVALLAAVHLVHQQVEEVEPVLRGRRPICRSGPGWRSR